MEKTTEEIINLINKPLNKFFCSLEDNNEYQFQMIKIKILDIENKLVFLNEKREIMENNDLKIDFEQIKNIDYNKFRTQTIKLDSKMLKSEKWKSKLKFKVGDKNAKNLKIIEKFYFKNKLIKEISGEFPFCVSNSLNNWELYYNPPKFNDEEIQFIINNPGSIESDSFYFINNKLIIQNKNYYHYFK